MADRPEDIAAEVCRRAGNRALLLLTDFDGTLCEFDPDPARVVLTGERQRLLRELSSGRAVTGIISGRRIQDLRERVGTAGFVYLAGFHGMEIEGPSGAFRHPDAVEAETLVRAVAATVVPRLSRVPGVFVEDKDFAIALHFREASPAAKVVAQSEFLTAADDALASGRLRLMPGSEVLELLPNTRWNKGSALAWIRERAGDPAAPLATVYIGDDVTDENAFDAVGPEGVTIGASDRVARAEFRVDGPPGVEAFLRALCGTLS